MNSTLNQQIADVFGYFVATEEDWNDLIHIYLVNPYDGTETQVGIIYPLEDKFREEGYLEDSWGLTWEHLPNWEHDLGTAIKLTEYIPDAPEGEEDSLIWHMSSPDNYVPGYSVFIYNEYGEGIAKDDNPATAICKAWLDCIRQNKEYWEEEWEEPSE